MGDFLRTNASTPYVQNFAGAGRTYRVATNSAEILAALGMTFSLEGDIGTTPAFCMRFWVDSMTSVAPPWPRPYIRGWGDLIYASFAPGNFGIIDLDSHRIAGRFTPEMASDTSHWNRVILPMLLSIISGAMGAVELHCACVADGERGLLLSGQSRSGKSTLALALASLGFGLLSDDRILCWNERGELQAWTPLTELKLRSEAMAWFKDLGGSQASAVESHEESLRFVPETLSGITRLRNCQPCAVFFLERTDSVRLELTAISPREAERRLGSDLLHESAKVVEHQSSLVSTLARMRCCKVRYGADPWTVAKGIISCFHGWESKRESRRYATANMDGRATRPAIRTPQHNQNSGSEPTHNYGSRVDAIGRVLPAAHHDLLPIMGKGVSVETNSPDILARLRRLFSVYSSSDTDSISFRWRIITQPDDSTTATAFRRFAFSDLGIRFAQFGQRNFIAVDLRLRRAVAFITETMANDEVTFTTPFLDSLFCMCSASLGFLPLFSSSVAIGGKGILILGEPGNGKTTASYILAKSGMELLADEGVFLEQHDQSLRAWGGFWPIAFRADALQFFPELKDTAKPFAYQDFAYFHLDKDKLHKTSCQTVTPVACVFLERFVSSRIRVSPLEPADLLRRVSDNLLFEEERRFRRQQLALLERLARLPGYRIAYGVDPADAAMAIKNILVRHVANKQPVSSDPRLRTLRTQLNQR